MSHRNENIDKDHFDLLPFIAILMCMLGTLLLVTISVAALSMGPGLGEGWIPVREGTETSKTPVLIEWDGTVTTFHRDGKKIPLRLTAITEQNNPEFDRLLEELVQNRETHYALFAVRPSGFDSFNEFANAFKSRDISIGYEPIKQERSVRLLKEESHQ